MDQCHLSFWREEREVPRSESGLGPGLPSPPPRHRLEDRGVSGVTTSGQQSGGFPFSPRQELIPYPTAPSLGTGSWGQAQLALLSTWVGSFPERPGPCPVSSGDRYYLQ